MSAPDDLIADRYRLVRLVGSGGMGAVWEALDERLGRPVALKLLHKQFGLAPADAELNNQRAMREARITARVHHRHAVPVFDVVEHEGRPCLVMQFLPSIALSTLLKETGTLEPAEAAKVGAQISSALAAAHAVGVVHRDVKPGNILVGDDDNVMISDFGISHAFGDATLTATGLVHGTPAFLAPEVARGAATTFASDVFSLGATLYAAVEGRPPFGTDPNTMALLHRVASGQFASPERAGPLTDLIVAMLATDPQARPTMKDVADAITEVVHSGSAVALPPTDQPTVTAATRPLPSGPAPVPTPAEQPTAVFGRDDVTPRRPVSAAAAPLPLAAAGPNGSTGLTGTTGPSGPPTPAAPVPAVTSGPPVARGPRRRAALLVALVVVLLLIGVIAAVALNRDRATQVADPTTRVSTSSEPPSPEPTQSANSTPPSATPSPSDEPSATPSPTPSATPSPTPTASPTGATAEELADAISSYYALMPDDTDEGWTRLTAAYQRNPSGGKDAYENFWKEIEQVSVSNVVGRPPNRAEATVRYVFKDDDRNSTERTQFGLVKVDGIWKINSSGVTGG